jgi:mannose-6-phosphate isomerase-like protein (cupin superfamily)
VKVRRFEDCAEIVANDGCRLRELLHPDRGAAGLPYSLARARLGPGESTAPHRLTGESEVYYILEGTGRLHVGETSAAVAPGDTVVVPAGAVQWLVCTGAGPLEFLNIVSPPWRADHDLRE